MKVYIVSRLDKIEGVFETLDLAKLHIQLETMRYLFFGVDNYYSVKDYDVASEIKMKLIKDKQENL